jgi:hypothetical protein
MIAVDLVTSRKVHDQAKFQEADRKWDPQRRGHRRVPEQGQSQLAKGHAVGNDENSSDDNQDLRLRRRLNHNWDEDVKAFDAVYDHILKMAERAFRRIIKQFPKKFSDGAPLKWAVLEGRLP